MGNAIALHVGPELERVDRHAPEVLGRIERRLGIDTGCARLLGNLRELVRNHELLRSGNCLFEILVQLLDLRWILPDALAVLHVIRLVGGLYFSQRDLFLWPVRRADVLGPFESQVFEHVRQSRLSARIVAVACIHHRVIREDRSLGPFADQQGQTVW